MRERRNYRFARRPVRWTLLLPLLLGSALTMAQELVPFTASYAADMRKIPVNGEATHSLEPTENGNWRLSFNAGMFVARLSEESVLRLEDDRIVPLTYHYQRRGLGRGRETVQFFDWTSGVVTGEHKGEPFTLPTEPGLLDQTTYQLALQRDLAAGKQDMTYRVVDGDSIDEYRFRVVGEDRVTTRVGQFDAIEVERVREPESKRQTTLWFAKDWQYLLVRLKQIETDGQEYQIVLKDAVLDGDPVEGIPVGSE
ncbi:Protein of unknown function [Halopseudomonas xinjiangensis]|uniref:Dehydrogenase n=1 Tax=Halopseudomonas xinjiangensis TaxID=487184 RepID=A0A1H1UL94_9GAMM|nr:Protein of unknown function [Halopseudomonas xinjiangensis]